GRQPAPARGEDGEDRRPSRGGRARAQGRPPRGGGRQRQGGGGEAMKRLRVAVLAAGAAALSCVPGPEDLGAAFGGAADDLMTGGKELAAQGGALAAQAQECHRLSTFDVPLKEETAVGGAVAVKWVSKGGGLVLGSNDPAAPARGPKDQMTVYV